MKIASLHPLIEEVRKTAGFVRQGDYSPAAETTNEYCLFLKPELTAVSREVYDKIARLIDQHLEDFGQEVVMASAMEAAYIARHRIAEQHYGVINQVSEQGARALSQEAQEKLAADFPQAKAGNYQLLGGHELLRRYPFFTPEALAVFHDNLENHKLAPGTHCVKATVRGAPVLLFNGFHPEQLLYFTTPGTVILALIVRSKASWKSIRQELAGATNPAKAAAGSIRGALYQRRQELGLAEVSSGRNGVHLSAGPLEGMVEVCRYASDFGDPGKVIQPEATTFGQLLLRSGFDRAGVRRLAENPTVEHGGRRVSLFDLTEEVDAAPALERIREAAFE
jgi:nucleoside diphosphate kinase